MDSPFAVTRAASVVKLIIISRELGRAVSFFHGPGESDDNSGEGKGVTSAIALSIGDDKAELGAEPNPELLPMLLAKWLFMLGVRPTPGIGMFDDFVDNFGCSLKLGVMPLAFVIVVVNVGFMSVWIRRPALRGLGLWVSDLLRREVVSRSERPGGDNVLGGGDGAVVANWKIASVLEV
jgi:hypothetical protein